MANVNLTNETIYSDGSGYLADAECYGMEYTVNFVAGEVRLVRIGGTSYRQSAQYRGTEKTAAKKIKEAVSDKLNAMPEFMAAHRKLYELG